MIASRQALLLRPIRALASLTAAAIGWVIVCVTEPGILPPPELPSIVREKTAHLAAHGNDYDAIFLGSSRIECHIMPELFDRLMAEKGAPMRSFNFGVLNLYPPEDDYVLDLILAQPHARLRWVFVEADFLNTAVQNGEAGTLRGVYWHDWPRLLQLCRCLALTRGAGFRGFRRDGWDAIERGRNFLEHAQMFWQRSVNLGRGGQLLERWLLRIPPAAPYRAALGEAGDGWTPALTTAHTLALKQSGQFGSDLKKRTTTNPPMRDEADPVRQSVLAGMLSKIAAAGATPVILAPPRVRRTYYYPEPALCARYPVIDLCVPARFPDLYREDLRIDGSHLNAAGAEVFTRILVEQFLSTAGVKRP